MFLEPERWNDAYAEILRECGGGGGRRPSRPVLVVVAATSVDAVCASRIWTYWMRADGIVYELLAADQWTIVQERLLSGTKGEESEYASFSYYYGACLLFNMGATVNLTRLLSVPCPPPRHHTGLDDVRMENVPRKLPCKIFVVDGRRPIHLANLYDRSHIVVLCDRLGCGGTGGADNENDDEDDDDDVPSDGDNLSGTESSTDEEDEDDDDDSDEDDESDDDDEDEGEHEFQEGDLQNPASKRHVHGRDEMKEDEDDDNALDKENEPSSVNKMRKPQSSTANNSSDPVNMTATTIDTALTSTTMDVDHDDDDDENNNHSTGNLWPSLSTHNHQEHDSSFAENNDENSNNDVPEASQPDDEVPPMPVLTPRELHRHRRERLRRYYARGTYRGSPSSFVSWHMTSQSRFAQSADLLWLAMTGVSGAFGYHELDRHAYMALAEHLQQACEVLFPTDPYLRHSNSHGNGSGNNGASSTVYAEYLMTNSNSNNHYDNAGTTTASTRTKIGVSENGRILCEPEFRFFLLRQSTLYQAMIQSDYIATTWQITTAAGRLKLHEWLATLGFPLHDCQQPFGLLKPALRRRLQPAVRETAPQYGLPDLEVPGFFRVTGFQSLLSAADAAHAIAALLALPAANPSSSSTSSSLEQEPARKQERNQPTQQAQPNPIVEHNTAVIQKSFQLAFDALNYQDADPYGNSGSDSSSNNNSMSTLVNGSLSSGHTTTGIAGGFRLASHLQHAIQMTAASLMDRRAITRLSHFRYAYITCSSNVSSSNSNNTNSQQTQAAQTTTQKFHVFAQPLVLTRLAYYLMDWHRASNQWTGSKARPLILCAQDPRTASYTVVGQVYPETEGSLVRNTLGQYFSLAAETLNTSSGANNNNQTTAATVRLDYSMDSHIVQVAETHVQRFIEQLHYLMDSV